MLLNAVAMTVIIRYPDQDDSGGESRPDEKNVLRSNFAARNVSVDGMSASSWTASWDSFQLLLLPRRTEFRIRFNHLSIGRLVTLPEQQLLLVRVLFFFLTETNFQVRRPAGQNNYSIIWKSHREQSTAVEEEKFWKLEIMRPSSMFQRTTLANDEFNMTAD